MAANIHLASSGGDIKIWDMPELAMAKTFSPHSQPVGSLCWSPNNQYLASAANDKVVVTYIKGDAHDVTEITAGDHKDVVSCVTFNWNDTSIASGSVNGDILLHNVISGQASDPLRLAKTQAVRDIQFSHFKKSLFGAVSDDSALNLWDSNTRKLFMSFASDHKAPATGLSFSPMNDMLLCSVGLDKRIVFYDVQGRKSVKVMTAESPLTSVDFMSDGATLAVGSTRGKIYIYDLRSGSTPVNTTVAHKTSVQSLSFQSATKVKSQASSSRTTQPSSLPNSKPQKSSEQQTLEIANSQPPSPRTKPQQLINTPMPKQNGVKDEEEDLFSPLREVKTPVIHNKQVNISGSSNFKESNPPDGVFSPIGSNVSADANSHPPLYHKEELLATSDSNTTVDMQRPTDQQPIANEAPVSPLKNVRTSATRSLTELGTAGRDEAHHEGMQKSNSDTKLITNSQHTSGAMTRGNVGLSTDMLRQATPGNEVGIVNEDNREQSKNPLPVTQSRRPSQGFSSPHGSPSAIRRPGEGTEITSQMSNGQDSHIVSPAHSLIFDRVKQRTETLPSGATGLTLSGDPAGDTAGATGNAVGMLPFQVEFMKNLIDESLDEFRVAIHKEIVNVQNELKGLIEKYSVNEALVSEIQRLKEENNRLNKSPLSCNLKCSILMKTRSLSGFTLEAFLGFHVTSCCHVDQLLRKQQRAEFHGKFVVVLFSSSLCCEL
ncbi:Protein NEDD1 [Acropora cervicornis]|uniref:Protein NEDD1 n=1 Tax=Acropora cervicornis TaxID=6130 RepID=A0AAD9R1T0_ACRCE|nr:Protein NEDD1 [Acropora cervicornis]